MSSHRTLLSLLAVLLLSLAGCRAAAPAAVDHRTGVKGNYALPTGPCSGDSVGQFPSCTVLATHGTYTPVTKPGVLTTLPTPIAYFDANYGVTLATSAVNASGTSPPAVTLTGTPVAGLTSVEIDVTVGGAMGTALFQFKVNGTLSAAGIPTAATYALGVTGLTANFAAGTYATDNVYTATITVSSWTDQQNSHAVTSAGAAQPILCTSCGPGGGLALQFNGSSNYLTGSWTEAQPLEIYALAQFPTSGTTGTIVDGATVNTARIYRNTATTQWSIYAGSNGDSNAYLTGEWNTFAGVFNGASSFIWSNPPPTWQSSNLGLSYPAQSTTPLSKSVGTGNPGGLTVGSAGNQADKAQVNVAAIAIYTGPLSSAQRTAVNNFFALRTNAFNTLALDGNSFLVVNTGALAQSILTGLTSFGGVAINNGQPGWATPQVAALSTAATDPFIGSMRGSGNVVVFVEVTNDIYYGASAATAFANVQGYVTARLAAGWGGVVVVTPLSRSGGSTPVNFNTTRAAVIALLRSAYGTQDAGIVPHVALADPASDPNIGIDGAESNTTYFLTDLTHLNTTGSAVEATYITQAIQSLGFNQVAPRDPKPAVPGLIVGVLIPIWLRRRRVANNNADAPQDRIAA